MKILLSILPVFWPKMPPIGLSFLQSYLSKKGINSDIVDLNNLFYNLAGANLKKEWLVSCNQKLEENILSLIRKDFPKEFNQVIKKFLSYEIIGFSCFKSNILTTIKLAEYLKSRKKTIKVVLGGPEITRLYFKTGNKVDGKINNIADFLVVGEGEKPLYNLLNNNPVKQITIFEELKDLNELGFLSYEGLKLGAYPSKNALPLQFSRGCIRKCSFCSERLLYKGFRSRGVEQLIEEVRYHKEKNKIDYFVFFDSLINADLNKLNQLCEGIIENFGSINWEAQIAIRKDMPLELLKKMKESGCFNLFVGLESGSDLTLKRMNKGFTKQEALVFLKKLNQAGLWFGVSMIVGFPKETEKEFKESLNFLIENKKLIPKIEQVNPFTYYEGTDIDRKADYKFNKAALSKWEIFVQQLKRHNFKYTKAFLGNLIEKSVGNQ